MAVLEVEQVNT